MKKLLLIAISVTTFIASCDIYPQDDYEEFYVVEAYLVANRQLPEIRLSTTLPADEFYSIENAGVNNANVEVRLLKTGPESNIEEIFTYSNSAPGTYTSDQTHAVLPTRTYNLHVSFPGSQDIVTAHTVVPDSFKILEGVRDSIVYQSSEQLEITLSESSYPGRQNVFVFNALSQNPVPENLTPLYSEFYEDSEQPEEDLYNFSNNSSGLINEGNFEVNPDGTFTINFPWIGIAFYEDNLIVANTMDDNIYDFVRSQRVQLGGSTLSPGEIQNVIYHVNGGIGVFGALASDTATTFVKRNPKF